MNNVANLTLVDAMEACAQSNAMNMMRCLWQRRERDLATLDMFCNRAWHACPTSACHLLASYRCPRQICARRARSHCASSPGRSHHVDA